MVPLLVAAFGLALLFGFFTGWASRAQTHFCPGCGRTLRCAECGHIMGGRAHARRRGTARR